MIQRMALENIKEDGRHSMGGTKYRINVGEKRREKESKSEFVVDVPLG